MKASQQRRIMNEFGAIDQDYSSGGGWMASFKRQVDIAEKKFWAKRGIDSSRLGRYDYQNPVKREDK